MRNNNNSNQDENVETNDARVPLNRPSNPSQPQRMLDQIRREDEQRNPVEGNSLLPRDSHANQTNSLLPNAELTGS